MTHKWRENKKFVEQMWKKGQSGNPAGPGKLGPRPPKPGSMTFTLREISEERIRVAGIRDRIAAREVIARMAMDLLTEGKTTYVDGTEFRISTTQWKELMEWVFSRLDGPPNQKIDITSGDEPLGPKLDLSSLSDEELVLFAGILRKAGSGSSILE